ncbi:xanthine permease, partial [Lacticaseibacillus rhamnosus MTCC 5462]
PVAFQNLGGGSTTAKDFGNMTNLFVGAFTVLLILAINVWGRGFLHSIAILVGLIAGTVLGGFLGLVSFQPVIEASWFHVPTPILLWGSTV